MNAPTLPLDIWWLVCQELTARRDFQALYNLSLSNRTVANLALPNLYSIHEYLANDVSVKDNLKLACLFRSIILSSIGEAAFPYCLWIRNLKLGELRELLHSMNHGSELRRRFFDGGMGPFKLQKTTTKMARQSKPWLDFDGIVNKVGEAITLFVKESADRENRAVALTHLEGQHIPMDLLPVWMSRLTTLTSLHIQDGSVIGEPVALSIRDSCPKFRELTCYLCDGVTVDEDFAAFFKALRPNSLEVFCVSSRNHLGREALAALSLHAASLKKLDLSGLHKPAFGYLDTLRQCVNLKSLALDADRLVNTDWRSEYGKSFSGVVSWIGACTSLANLRLWNVPSAASLLKDVFKSSRIRLKVLDLKLVDADDELYSLLGSQTELEELFFRSTDDDLDCSSPQHTKLIGSICKCQGLRVLDIMETILFAEDLGAFAECLSRIQELSFDGDLLDDSVFDSLFSMRNLRHINISASTMFTADRILQYIDSVGEMGLTEGEFSLSIMNQSREAMVLKDQVDFLVNHARDLGVKLEILHPEEEHESDFSD